MHRISSPTRPPLQDAHARRDWSEFFRLVQSDLGVDRNCAPAGSRQLGPHQFWSWMAADINGLAPGPCRQFFDAYTRTVFEAQGEQLADADLAAIRGAIAQRVADCLANQDWTLPPMEALADRELAALAAFRGGRHGEVAWALSPIAEPLLDLGGWLSRAIGSDSDYNAYVTAALKGCEAAADFIAARGDAINPIARLCIDIGLELHLNLESYLEQAKIDTPDQPWRIDMVRQGQEYLLDLIEATALHLFAPNHPRLREMTHRLLREGPVVAARFELTSMADDAA